MRRNKRWIALFLSTALAVSALTGCGGSDDTPDTPSTDDEQKTEDGNADNEGDGGSDKVRFDDLGGMNITIEAHPMMQNGM